MKNAIYSGVAVLFTTLVLGLTSAYAQPKDPIEVKEVAVEYSSERSILKFECRLNIPKPWHINSDSLAQDYLIATGIALEDTSLGHRVKKKYPKAHKMTLFGQEIEVFQGELGFSEYFYLGPKTKFPLKAKLQYQSCSDKICLPPVFRNVTVEKTGENKYTARL